MTRSSSSMHYISSGLQYRYSYSPFAVASQKTTSCYEDAYNGESFQEFTPAGFKLIINKGPAPSKDLNLYQDAGFFSNLNFLVGDQNKANGRLSFYQDATLLKRWISTAKVDGIVNLDGKGSCLKVECPSDGSDATTHCIVYFLLGKGFFPVRIERFSKSNIMRTCYEVKEIGEISVANGSYFFPKVSEKTWYDDVQGVAKYSNSAVIRITDIKANQKVDSDKFTFDPAEAHIIYDGQAKKWIAVPK